MLANRLDRLIFPAPKAKLGIISTGKSYLDLRQALDDLGIDETVAAEIGLRVLKLGLTYPIASETVTGFAEGLKQIIVVEEKRGLIESQVKEILYGRRAAPGVIGKKDEDGNWLFPSNGALSSNQIAEAIASRVLALGEHDQVKAGLARLEGRKNAENAITMPMLRTPYFCSGCPHNSSTRVPDGSVARAGIGCHYMAQWMDRDNLGYTQMGGEGGELDRRSAVLQAQACVPEPGRWHLFSFRPDGGARGDRLRRQHHLQDPLQRCRRHDRRAGGGRPADRAADQPPGDGRRGDRRGRGYRRA